MVFKIIRTFIIIKMIIKFTKTLKNYNNIIMNHNYNDTGIIVLVIIVFIKNLIITRITIITTNNNKEK